MARFFGVEGADRFVFTHGSTESLNLAALGWADRRLRPGDVVAVAEDNRHANIVPRQMLAQRRGVRVEWIPVNSAGPLDYDAWCRIAEARPRLVALCQQPNEVVVLDVRTPEEYAERHIVNARLLTLDTIDETTAAEAAPDKEAPVFVYCPPRRRSSSRPWDIVRYTTSAASWTGLMPPLMATSRPKAVFPKASSPSA